MVPFRFLARTAVALVALTAFGALAAFVLSVPPAPAPLLALFLLALVLAAVVGAARLVRRTSTPYWG